MSELFPNPADEKSSTYKDYHRRYYEKNKQLLIQKQREYLHADPERWKQYLQQKYENRKKYRQEHLEECRAKEREYARKRYQAKKAAKNAQAQTAGEN